MYFMSWYGKALNFVPKYRSILCSFLCKFCRISLFNHRLTFAFQSDKILPQNKENGKMLESKKLRKFRGTSVNYDGHTKFYDSSEEKQNSSVQDSKAVSNGNLETRESCSNSFDSSANLDGTLVDGDQTMIENGSPSKTQNNSFGTPFSTISPSKLSKPPPLPPKPKNLQPIILKSNHIMSSRPFQRITQINHVNPADTERKSTT